VSLKIHIKRVDGRIDRIAGDEADPRNVPQGFSRSSAIPGGWTSCSFTLPRSALRRDLDPFDEIVVMGDGNEVLFEGYGIEYPAAGEDDTVTVTATGWASILKDNPCPTLIPVDRDLNAWVSTELKYRTLLTSIGLSPVGDPNSSTDTVDGLPGLQLVIPVSPATPRPVSYGWYDAGSAKVASIYYDMVSVSVVGDSGNFGVADDAYATGSIAGADLLTGANSSAIGTFTPSTPKRWAYAGITREAAVANTAEKSMTVRKLAVYGDHPIPQVAVSGEPNGVLASDVLAHLLEANCPELNVRRGPGGIEASTFVIPHLVLRDIESLEEAVLRINRFDIADWGVYENRTPFLRPPGSGRTFVARTDDNGVTYNDAGLTGDELYTGVVVRYTDPSGKARSVGPVGSGCDTETPALSLSGSNALTKRGRRRILPLSISTTAVERDAIQTGSRALQEKNQLETRGDAEISGVIRDVAGIAHPVSKIKAGDQIIFPDREWKPRRIVEETWTAETDTISLSLDASPSKIDAMMERMGVFNEAENI
jgi:hypothetical protein